MSKIKTDDDFAAHEKTYDQFIKITKWSVISLIVLVLFLYVAINP